jgi:phospholipid/cholesterol/gamma-HCH transport system substrate-binding protein
VLFRNMADTFEAFVRCEDCLRATIELTPPTEDASIQSFRVQQPFLADFTDLSTRLRPGVSALPVYLPGLSRALAIGTPVVRSSVILDEETRKVFVALDDLVRDPSTLLALRDTRDSLSLLSPLLNYIAPYQTVCNYSTSFFTGLQGDVGFETANGSAQAALLKLDGNSRQDNKMGDLNDRPADIPKNVNPHGAIYPDNSPEKHPWEVQHTQAYPPAIDAQGNADCQIGQEGFLTGPANAPLTDENAPRRDYTSASVEDPSDQNQIREFDRTRAGGSHTVNTNNTPGLSGPTFIGIKNLADVP